MDPGGTRRAIKCYRTSNSRLEPIPFTMNSGRVLNDDSGPRTHLACMTTAEFIAAVFMDSDTDMMALSFVPTRRDASPLIIKSEDGVDTLIWSLAENGVRPSSNV